MGGWKFYRSIKDEFLVKFNNNYPDFSYTVATDNFCFSYGITYPYGVFFPSEETTKKKWYKAIRNLIIRSKI